MVVVSHNVWGMFPTLLLFKKNSMMNMIYSNINNKCISMEKKILPDFNFMPASMDFRDKPL